MEVGKERQAFLKAVEIDGRREEFVAAAGEAHYRLGNLPAAAEAFDRTIELAPEMSEHWVRFVTFLMDEGRFDEAWENLNAAFMNTYGTELKYCHAAYCFRTGDRNEGLHLLQEAMVEDYPLHASLFNLCPELGQDTEVMSIIATYRPV
jgi:tetratricopeptide (TPR) repeat protein